MAIVAREAAAVICRTCHEKGVTGPHDGCRGGTWCDCQHRTDRTPAEKSN